MRKESSPERRLREHLVCFFMKDSSRGAFWPVQGQSSKGFRSLAYGLVVEFDVEYGNYGLIKVVNVIDQDGATVKGGSRDGGGGRGDHYGGGGRYGYGGGRYGGQEGGYDTGRRYRGDDGYGGGDEKYGGGGGGGSGCYKCRKDGHFTRECSQGGGYGHLPNLGYIPL
ncbi:hypothetical protein H5410_001734 [Solanum commersonii]|uniref:CCHC-type domain-containing protein n=1 Tax=Solanum commersonii TaxID=4109 RepID=A0A9J6AZZ9_SOLCO|nr:hypothetical protein H5410_001734 [Solanum commersonii]